MAYSRNLSKMAIMNYQGLSRTVMDFHGLSWTFMDCHGLSWTIMEDHGLSRTDIDDRLTYGWTLVLVKLLSRLKKKKIHVSRTFIM